MGIHIPDRTSGNEYVQPVAVYKTEDVSLHKVTHDFTNKTTWYQNSTEVTGETLTLDSGTTYNSANVNWIDVVNRVTPQQHRHQSYKQVIYDGGTPVSEDDYTVNFANGTVTFNSTPSGAVTADYHYAGSSLWTMTPDANTVLLIEHSEIQFTQDVELASPLRFEIWVYNPLDLPNKVLYQYSQYNGLRDFVNEANLGTGSINQMGNLPGNVSVFPFNYGSIKPISSAAGAELRVLSMDDIPLTGSYGTGTFYCLSRPE